MDENVSLKEHSNYRIGGPAKFFVRADDAGSLWAAVAFAKERRVPYFVLGGGTNVLVSDDGFDGVVIKPAIQFLETNDMMVRVGAGVFMSELLEFVAGRGLSGLEWAGGLPGTVGGAVRGNAGAFGGETKDAVKEIISVDVSGTAPKVIRRRGAQCAFGYRNSIFKINNGKEIILEATFELRKGDAKVIRETIEQKIQYRNERHPTEYPNIGSIFKNVPVADVPKELHGAFAHVIKTDPFPVVPTAYLISEAGLRGTRIGGAMVSEKHPNFIVNAGSARADEVKLLIGQVKSAVRKKYGIALEEEVLYL
ncbi:UDP-N-acetylmuramate dehydrogenase [Candidatus Azambacteria bacterium]|nr:UDP-N-acetylmuramate dehydrogenase [Candidatus Azambacteria bacterium]